jgi:hypothetical protein
MRRWTIGVMATVAILTSSVAGAEGPGHKRGVRYKGTVANVSPGKLMVSLAAPVSPTATGATSAAPIGTTQTFDIPADARISCRGRACTLAELTPGTPIKVKTVQRGGTTVVTEIRTLRPQNARPGCGASTGG